VTTGSEALAAFAASLKYADLPDEVLSKVKLHLLDLVGVALASSTMPFGKAVFSALAEYEVKGGCRVLGFGATLPAPWAALVNGTLAHGTDFDDTHQASVVHVSASVVPTALACAEQSNASGRDLIVALAAGMETAVRTGLVASGSFHERGFHPTGICGAFGATVAAAVLGGCGKKEIAHALGVAGSMAAGLLEFLTDGTWSKRLHGGWAAHSGIIAARMAKAGFSGPRAVLEGRFGLYRSHLGERGWDLSALTDGLGQHWELIQIALKPYPCCHYNHAFIDCAAKLRASAAFDLDDIEKIECFVPPPEVPIICEPAETKRVPQTDYDAKFSLPYAVACMLSRGHVDLDDFDEASIRDPRAVGLARRVEYLLDPGSEFPRRFAGRLRLLLRDGRVFEHQEPVNRGSAELPLAADEIIEKFRRNALRALSGGTVSQLIDAVQTIEQAPDIRRLTRLCCEPKHGGVMIKDRQ
jgi:2-methylcitrate dehydratase PrpD